MTADNLTPSPLPRGAGERHSMDAVMIGVAGLRGTVGGTLTPPVVSRMAAAGAVWL